MSRRLKKFIYFSRGALLLSLFFELGLLHTMKSSSPSPGLGLLALTEAEQEAVQEAYSQSTVFLKGTNTLFTCWYKFYKVLSSPQAPSACKSLLSKSTTPEGRRALEREADYLGACLDVAGDDAAYRTLSGAGGGKNSKGGGEEYADGGLFKAKEEENRSTGGDDNSDNNNDSNNDNNNDNDNSSNNNSKGGIKAKSAEVNAPKVIEEPSEEFRVPSVLKSYKFTQSADDALESLTTEFTSHLSGKISWDKVMRKARNIKGLQEVAGERFVMEERLRTLLGRKRDAAKRKREEDRVVNEVDNKVAKVETVRVFLGGVGPANMFVEASGKGAFIIIIINLVDQPPVFLFLFMAGPAAATTATTTAAAKTTTKTTLWPISAVPQIILVFWNDTINSFI